MNFLGRPDNIGEDIVRFVAGNGNAGALVSNQKGGRGVKGEGERVNNFRKLPLRSYFLIKRNEILNFIISLQRYELFYLVCDLPLLLDIQRERERESGAAINGINEGKMIFPGEINRKTVPPTFRLIKRKMYFYLNLT